MTDKLAKGCRTITTKCPEYSASGDIAALIGQRWSKLLGSGACLPQQLKMSGSKMQVTKPISPAVDPVA